ncbi:MAG: PAS domain S-box protein [Arcobacteraceae bacterium]|jgi:PAS domain S-box-containing protein|nr:PAS domain S-box protein [Arcobacteraceae bacterium]
MKKTIITSIVLLLFLSILSFNLYNAKIQITTHFKIDKIIETLILINKDFDLYIKSTLQYNNFDEIEEKIAESKKNFTLLSTNAIFIDSKNPQLNLALQQLQENMDKKLHYIGKVKGYRAVLNNSYIIIQKIKKNIKSDRFDDLYTVVLTINKNPTIDLKNILHHIDTLKPHNLDEELFLRHAKTITQYQLMLLEKQNDINTLKINQTIKQFHTLFEEYSNHNIEMMEISIIILFILLIVILALYFYTLYSLNIAHQDLSRFRKTLENSDNIVVITDNESKIKYVNQSFTNVTGYSLEEAIGQNPKILKSGRKSKEFYEELNKTIYNGNRWNGEFENIDKYGNLTYEKASITPVFDNKGKIVEFIAIKLDITQEVLANALVKEQQQELFAQQAKTALMGEMIGNIAHQWRQPLNTVSTMASRVAMQCQIGMINEADIIDDMNEILSKITYLSETIDTFRNYLKEKKELKEVILQERIKVALSIGNTTLKDNHIQLIDTIDYNNKIVLTTIVGELDQVIINIINNAKDIILEKNIKNSWIQVDLISKEDRVIITIEDNGGGIPQSVLPHIFDEYFTTKDEHRGTGLGLYMSYKIITESLNGQLYVKNTQNGAKFFIELPINL